MSVPAGAGGKDRTYVLPRLYETFAPGLGRALKGKDLITAKGRLPKLSKCTDSGLVLGAGYRARTGGKGGDRPRMTRGGQGREVDQKAKSSEFFGRVR